MWRLLLIMTMLLGGALTAPVAAAQHQGELPDLAAMLPRLTWAAVRTPPMPYRLLKLPNVYA